MLRQCGHIKASFVSDWPSVMVQKCGLRLLYQHDLSQFEQQLKHCNASISAHRDFICQFSGSGTIQEEGWTTHMPKIPNEVVSPLNKYDQLGFDGSCDYNSCCPPIEIPRWFNIRSDKSHVTGRLTRKLHDRCTWLGVALCAVFFVTEDVAGLNDVMDSISSCKLICHLKASNGLSVKPRHIHWPTKENLMMSVLGGGFTWLTYIPRGSFPDWLYDCASIKFSFQTNCHYLKVQNCGLCPLYQHSVEEFKNCMKSESEFLGILDQKKTENINRKICSGIQNVIRKTDTLGRDQCIFYNSRLPSSEFLEWFSHRSDEPRLKIPLPPNLYNDSTWMGLVLCAYFAIDENPTTHFDILDSDITYGLVYHLQTNVGSVRPLVAYHLTKENLVMLQQGGCILLSYEGRGSFQNCLNQVSCIKASFRADCPGLKVEKCGLRLLYHYDLEEFEQTISHSRNSSLDGWDIICQGTSSRTSSSIRRKSNFGNLRGPIDPKVKGKPVLEE
ncbi:uncharacterized protein LOC126699646 isoform X3 [Quercus robur]|uniref:uncharacterized protein LOC126699646 isoform X3 n=1 Tax=Quercus robur TaxID=38942 RepID=UPI002161E7DA|nr:uncharacterized protein LOC126699646 isoform X3 [Quercus robur]